MSKEKGNQLYKMSKYLEAIKQYCNYVATEHSDNLNAYCNMSLCYFKLNQFQKCIQACKNALEYNSEYPKVYYWLVKAYEKLQNHQYNVFINALNFCNYETGETKEKDQMKAIANQYKYKIQYQSRRSLILNQQIKSLLQLDKIQKNDKYDRNINEWKKIWNNSFDDKAKRDQYWNQIIEIRDTLDQQYATNLAYIFINQIKDDQQKRQKIELFHAQSKLNPSNQKVNINQNSLQRQHRNSEVKEEEDSSDNLFQSENEENKEFEAEFKQQNQIKQSNQKQTEKYKQKEEQPLSKMIDENDEKIPSQDEINKLYDEYFRQDISSSRDKFESLYLLIDKCLKSPSLTRRQKQAILRKVQLTEKNFELIRKSMTKNEQLKYYLQLKRNNLLQLAQIFTPKAI